MIRSIPTAGWQLLNVSSGSGLVLARKYLHHAAQFLAATGKFLVPPRDDDSHTSLSWHPELQALCSEAVNGIRVALHLSDCSILLVSDQSDIISRFSLAGQSSSAGLKWLKTELQKSANVNTDQLTLQLHYEIDPFPGESNSAVFPEPDEYFLQIAAYFNNAATLLDAVYRQVAASSTVRTWPHHFDMATLISLDQGKSAEQARSIGVGLSPGDASSDEPYFYVTPWPYPDVSNIKLPDLSNGHWNTEGWVGALLPAGKFAGEPDAEKQSRIASTFLMNAVNAANELLNL